MQIIKDECEQKNVKALEERWNIHKPETELSSSCLPRGVSPPVGARGVLRAHMPRQIADLAKEPAAQGTPVAGRRLSVCVLHVVPQLFVAGEHLGTVLAEKVHCLLYLKSAVLCLVLRITIE